MIKLSEFLIFTAAVGVILTYMGVVHRILSRADRGGDDGGAD